MSTKRRGNCFPRRHMPAAVDSFYWFALNRYKKAGVFRRDDRRCAEDYGVSKNTVTRWVAYLEHAGWIVARGKRLVRNKETGMYNSIPYDVLEHDAWAKKHPGKCRFLSDPNDEGSPVPETGTGNKSPVPETGTGPVPVLDNHRSLFSHTTSPQNRDVSSQSEVSTVEKDSVGEKNSFDPAPLASSHPGAGSSAARRNTSLTETPSGITLNEKLRWIAGASDTGFYSGLSDGEFNARALDKYPHRDELRVYCERAIEARADKPYSRRNLAKVMAFAMREMMRLDKMEVPKYWVPAIKKLEGK